MFHRGHGPHWHYPNLTFVLISLLFTIYMVKSGLVHQLVALADGMGLIGVFLAGMFFVSTFTVIPAAAVLYEFAQVYPPVVIAIVGGVGSTIGDYLGLLFIRDRLLAELNPFLKALHLYKKIRITHTKYFAWLAPVVGAIILASPFPDEVGLTLLGVTKIKPQIFMSIAFLINVMGLFLLALIAS